MRSVLDLTSVRRRVVDRTEHVSEVNEFPSAVTKFKWFRCADCRLEIIDSFFAPSVAAVDSITLEVY